MAAFRGMHVSPAKHSSGKCDRKVWQTDGQTKWSLCVAMLRRRHKNDMEHPKTRNTVMTGFQISRCPISHAVLKIGRASQFWNQLARGTSSFWLALYQHRSVKTVYAACSEVPGCKTNFYLCSPHVPIVQPHTMVRWFWEQYFILTIGSWYGISACYPLPAQL